MYRRHIIPHRLLHTPVGTHSGRVTGTGRQSRDFPDRRSALAADAVARRSPAGALAWLCRPVAPCRPCGRTSPGRPGAPQGRIRSRPLETCVAEAAGPAGGTSAIRPAAKPPHIRRPGGRGSHGVAAIHHDRSVRRCPDGTRMMRPQNAVARGIRLHARPRRAVRRSGQDQLGRPCRLRCPEAVEIRCHIGRDLVDPQNVDLETGGAVAIGDVDVADVVPAEMVAMPSIVMNLVRMRRFRRAKPWASSLGRRKVNGLRSRTSIPG